MKKCFKWQTKKVSSNLTSTCNGSTAMTQSCTLRQPRALLTKSKTSKMSVRSHNKLQSNIKFAPLKCQDERQGKHAWKAFRSWKKMVLTGIKSPTIPDLVGVVDQWDLPALASCIAIQNMCTIWLKFQLRLVESPIIIQLAIWEAWFRHFLLLWQCKGSP